MNELLTPDITTYVVTAIATLIGIKVKVGDMQKQIERNERALERAHARIDLLERRLSAQTPIV